MICIMSGTTAYNLFRGSAWESLMSFVLVEMKDEQRKQRLSPLPSFPDGVSLPVIGRWLGRRTKDENPVTRYPVTSYR